jgi:hypothetical protein
MRGYLVLLRMGEQRARYMLSAHVSYSDVETWLLNWEEKIAESIRYRGPTLDEVCTSLHGQWNLSTALLSRTGDDDDA